MQGIINTKKLEKMLIKHWTDFIDVRAVIAFVKHIVVAELNFTSKCQILKVKISRFEPKNNFFIVWLETSILDGEKEVNITIETSIHLSGKIIYLNHC